jgi:hypothetical protein
MTIVAPPREVVVEELYTLTAKTGYAEGSRPSAYQLPVVT